MGNSITKSSTLCLLEIVYNLFTNQQNQFYKIVSGFNMTLKISTSIHLIEKFKDILKHLLCVKDEHANLCGSSWIVPLLLHREPQVKFKKKKKNFLN